MSKLYGQIPDDLGIEIPSDIEGVMLLRVEVDELWSFVGSKKNKQWVWLALDIRSRQVIAFHVGGRGKADAKQLWGAIPEEFKKQADFYTDQHDAYRSAFPKEKLHQVKSGFASLIERMNCTLRQRVSRLVRKSLSFSKKLENHIGAIKYFLFHYNIEAFTKFLKKNEFIQIILQS